jgi:RNA polymerase sigma-70 factor (ECF subfamily)
VANLPDEELAHQVASGEQQALLHLYDRHSSRVYALALRVLGDPMAAEEITQDVFFKLWSHANSYLASRGSFATWLLSIARHAAIDRLRAERRRPAVDDQDPGEGWAELPNEASTSEESRWRSLYFAVQALPPEQRQVIELAYYHGMSHSQIAEHLGWPLGTVKTRLRMGMEQLRGQWLESKG